MSRDKLSRWSIVRALFSRDPELWIREEIALLDVTKPLPDYLMGQYYSVLRKLLGEKDLE